MRGAMRFLALAAAACAATAAVAAPPTVPAGWQTYTNVTLGYVISYPADWRVDPKYIYAGFGPDHNIEGVAFEIPPAMAKGTNLSSNLTNVSVESRAGSGACDARRFIPDPEDMHTLNQFGRIWSVATTSDAGAGNFYDITVFVLKDSSPAWRCAISSTRRTSAITIPARSRHSIARRWCAASAASGRRLSPARISESRERNLPFHDAVV